MHVGLVGATGRLGTLVVNTLEQQGFAHSKITKEILSDQDAFKRYMHNVPELIILDVSLPEGTVTLCQQINYLTPYETDKIRGLIIGTTGHQADARTIIANLANKIPVCVISNFSKGIFLFEELLKAKTSAGMTVADLATQLGFALSIEETHHIHKKDIPSGTALTLASAAKVTTDNIHSIRAGQVVGEHSIAFNAPAECLKITHTAHSRALFAEGAVTLCKNIYTRRPAAGMLNKESFFCAL